MKLDRKLIIIIATITYKINVTTLSFYFKLV